MGLLQVVPAIDAGPLDAGPGSLKQVPVDLIDANPDQPRKDFDEVALAELRDSIAQVGVLQPVVVRPIAGRFQLVMGERRVRAARLAGLAAVPAVVRNTNDRHMLRDALLENIQRAEINPLEEAAAYRQLLDDFSATHEDIARMAGKSRSHVTHTLKFLDLPAPVQRRVAAGVLSAGHAKVLTGVRESGACQRLADRIVAENLTVRAAQELATLGNLPGFEPDRPRKRRSRPAPVPDDDLRAAERSLGDMLDTRVRITATKQKGRIVIDFGGRGDLMRVLDELRRGGAHRS